MILTLTRDNDKNPFAQTGVLTGLSRTIYTLEEPWRGNARRVSCIPVGTYQCRPHGWEANSRVRFPRVWEVMNVKDRTAILIHAGNTHLDTMGCILVGFSKANDRGEPKLRESRIALDFMRREIGPQGFTLVVK